MRRAELAAREALRGEARTSARGLERRGSRAGLCAGILEIATRTDARVDKPLLPRELLVGCFLRGLRRGDVGVRRDAVRGQRRILDDGEQRAGRDGVAFLDGELPLADRILLVSGRTSFEILQKAAVAGVPIVAAVSAPSSLAVSLADRLGITLVGFLRGPSFNVYTHPERIDSLA